MQVSPRLTVRAAKTVGERFCLVVVASRSRYLNHPYLRICHANRDAPLDATESWHACYLS